MTRPSIWKRITQHYTVAEAITWLARPHPQLEGESAASAIREGRVEQVHAILDRLESGVYL